MRIRACLLSVLACLAGLLVALAPATPASAAITVYPVPTSGAGLGRIVTAPDGSMWFLMETANKVGRITTGGQLQEFALPDPGSTVEDPANDLDVSPDGSVWVTTSHGSTVTRLSSSGALLNHWQFDPDDDPCVRTCPYAGDIRVGPDGVAWITMNYGDSFIVKFSPTGMVTRSANAPACDDVLGEAADGTMWCQGGLASAQHTIVRVNADAAGGTTYPLPADATYPRALAAGPVGSIWFTRHNEGTWMSKPSDGSIGYLDAATGTAKIWSTGSNSAPEDLVRGPDGHMWFTNVGYSPGIGHISAQGVGVVSKVGNHQPRSLTFGPDGAVWFTDRSTNSIVRVTTDQLQTTTADLGDGVTMLSPTAPPPAEAAAGTLPAVKKPVKVRRNAFPLTVACPATATAACAGRVSVETARPVRSRGGKKAVRQLVRPVRYSVGPGGSTTVRLRLTGAGRALVKRRTAVRAELTAAGAERPAASRTFTLRR